MICDFLEFLLWWDVIYCSGAAKQMCSGNVPALPRKSDENN